jgi:protein phosphatase
VLEEFAPDIEMKIRPGIELGNLTDVGCQRTENEDYYCYAEPEDDEVFACKGRLVVIADGMGGHQGGEIASGIAIEQVRAAYFASEAADVETALLEALHAAHLAIQQCGSENPEFAGMGTTCVAVVLRDGKLSYAHVGDSRLYLIRHGAISQLTRDHTVVSRLIEEGIIAEYERDSHPDKGVLTAALGASKTLMAEVDEAPISLQAGDALLLCTDGLHDLVADDEMAAAVENNPPARACRSLVDLAKARGGHDNITVQVLRIGDS